MFWDLVPTVEGMDLFYYFMLSFLSLLFIKEGYQMGLIMDSL